MVDFKAPKGIDPLYFPGKSFNYSFVTILEIATPGMEYTEFRDDPVFPATHHQSGVIYSNNSTVPGLLGCVNSALIYDPDLDQCWNWPETSADLTIPLSDPMFNKYDGVRTNADIARVLLSGTIYGSFLGMTSSRAYTTLEAKSHCNDLFCFGLPREQWKVEARHWFETSLAQMQYWVLDIVRGVDEDSDYGKSNEALSSEQKLFTFLDIPPSLRGICHMGKFKSVGWRNVSVWGLVGLLSRRRNLAGQRHNRIR